MLVCKIRSVRRPSDDPLHMFVDEVDIQVAAGDGGAAPAVFAARSSFLAADLTAATEARADRSTPWPARISTRSSISASIPSSSQTWRARLRAPIAPARDAHDLELEMPVGTLVLRDSLPTVECDLIADLRRDWSARAGRAGRIGGRGNAQFASSTNRAPRRVEEGRPGETKQLSCNSNCWPT